jgi:hypothetical protein
MSPMRAGRQAQLMSALNADPVFRARKLAGAAAYRERVGPRPKPLAIPQHTHPLIRGLFLEINAQRATLDAVAGRSGVSFDSLRFWRTRHMPRVDLLEAALNALDLELAIVPRGTRGPDGFPRTKSRKQQEGVTA